MEEDEEEEEAGRAAAAEEEEDEADFPILVMASFGLFVWCRMVPVLYSCFYGRMR